LFVTSLFSGEQLRYGSAISHWVLTLNSVFSNEKTDF